MTKHATLPLSLFVVGCSQLLTAQTVSIERFESTNGALAFGEALTPTPGTVGYYVDILGDISIFAAAFSFQQDLNNPSVLTSVFFPDGGTWNSTFIQKQSWDMGVDFPVAGIQYNTKTLGSFESLFGSIDDTVAFYSDPVGLTPFTEALDSEEANWKNEPPTFVRFGGDVATTGIFLDDKGNIIATSAVPELSSLSLIGLASLGLLARRR